MALGIRPKSGDGTGKKKNVRRDSNRNLGGRMYQEKTSPYSAEAAKR